MPGFLLHVGAQVMCAHAGQAQPTAPNPRVMVSGQPTILLSTAYVVAGCPFLPPNPGPCATGQWLVGTTRVTSTGQPLATLASQGLCAPTGTPLTPVVAQTRVTAT